MSTQESLKAEAVRAGRAAERRRAQAVRLAEDANLLGRVVVDFLAAGDDVDLLALVRVSARSVLLEQQRRGRNRHQEFRLDMGIAEHRERLEAQLGRRKCGASVDDRDPEDFRTFVCVKPEGHRSAHESLGAEAVWTDGEHWGDDAIRDANA